jgi:ribosomal protein S27AE
MHGDPAGFRISYADQIGKDAVMSDFDTDAMEESRHRYKLSCEKCGSLTIALPVNPSPDPHAALTCGRCGSPRGTLQALRDRSIGRSSNFAG